MLLRPSVTGAEWNSTTNDCVSAESASFFPLQVHGATATAAVTLSQTKNFSESALQHLLNRCVDQISDIESVWSYEPDGLGQELVVTAV